MFGGNADINDYELNTMIDKFTSLQNSTANKMKDADSRISKKLQKELLMYGNISIHLIKLREFRKQI